MYLDNMYLALESVQSIPLLLLQKLAQKFRILPLLSTGLQISQLKIVLWFKMMRHLLWAGIPKARYLLQICFYQIWIVYSSKESTSSRLFCQTVSIQIFFINVHVVNKIKQYFGMKFMDLIFVILTSTMRTADLMVEIVASQLLMTNIAHLVPVQLAIVMKIIVDILHLQKVCNWSKS